MRERLIALLWRSLDGHRFHAHNGAALTAVRSPQIRKGIAGQCLGGRVLTTSEEWFLETKPTCEAMIAAGYLRKGIPAAAGGENADLIDLAILGSMSRRQDRQHFASHIRSELERHQSNRNVYRRSVLLSRGGYYVTDSTSKLSVVRGAGPPSR
jgi:hypothetical protein